MEPSYIELYNKNELKNIENDLFNSLKSCNLCPHNCNANRTNNKKGKCNSVINPIVSSFHAHHGEESCLVGNGGSGTIFFTNCNLLCIFCQNYDISHYGHGDEISFEELAIMMLSLQKRGCHNINFVTPTHMIYPIIKALQTAIPMGLNVPLVYNSGGYDSVEILKLIQGIFDIYMPDFKYMNPETAQELSGVYDYPETASEALKEMYSQVGDLKINDRGIAQRGLMVRHLVLPNNIAASDRIISFLANLSVNTYVNIMDQYRPAFKSRECFDLKRRVSLQEFDELVDFAKTTGLYRIDSIIGRRI